MPIQRLNHAVLYVRDVERSVAFYRDVLGFRQVMGFPGAAFLQAEGSSNDHDLGLFQVGPAAGPSGAGKATVGLYHLAWEVDTLAELERVAAALPATPVGIRGAGPPDRPVRRVAVMGGAGDSAFDAVRRAGADAYVTADLRHHPASEALADQGFCLVDAGHWASEWPWLRQAAERLVETLSGDGTSVDTRVSTIVTDPWDLHVTSLSPDPRSLR